MTYLDDCGAPQRGTTDDRHLIILPPASAACRCRYQQSNRPLITVGRRQSVPAGQHPHPPARPSICVLAPRLLLLMLTRTHTA